MVRRRLFAGQQLRTLRTTRKLRQGEMASLMGISASYLSQLENDERPLTPALTDRLRSAFPVDWEDFASDRVEPVLSALREAASDLMLAGSASSEQIERVAEQYPAFAEAFVRLHDQSRRSTQRLEIIDEALGADNISGGRLPWEEVRDWFHHANNYVDAIDRAAERLALRLSGTGVSPSLAQMAGWLEANGVTVEYAVGGAMRLFDPVAQRLTLDPNQPIESGRFQMAYQLAALALREEIAAIVQDATLQSVAARQLLTVGLGNYAAGALLMPYEWFRARARELRHDIDQLRQTFGTSFEQACHRISTLQRPQARGIPMFFCKVDMAGNITKRHSATRLQFARFGGACPLWVVHEAVAIPDRIHVQAAEMPDGVRYVSIAKGLVKPTGSYYRPPRRYAVALGCEAALADEFIYADGLNLERPETVTRIGISCRICPRDNCDQRAFPPSDRAILVDPHTRDLVPYGITDM
ncbi:short-chain fatty acyl-CoA regulator family protein [Novosphingobium sp. MMS21-SN21R]|uniref:helix-turn-helix domain-containing protein n=1 Tax=Novosphingobium sp. MMS21-SN21R TaxID=2969298 RepID=UPI002888B48C|nr:short-chain fatty acyl-CoA regulator family protein [Novosphingobium sp. MMS21-SN21R]MDT0507119.1 short-chain fatty acyl-CoA regulator family protein [Novosphingobium sp. MMS21-SN21R]